MVSLEHPEWTSHLGAALEAGKTWYGKKEIFKADMEALKRIQVTLPDDAPYASS